MLNLGAGFGAVEAKVGGGKKFPEFKGYTWVITKVLSETSKAGNPMIRFEADIAEGEFTGFFSEYPKRYYQTYADEEGQARLKGIFETIIGDNPAMFPEAQTEAGINWAAFEESRLIGCTVGGVLKQDGKYSKLGYFCSKERAAEAKTVEYVAVEEDVIVDETTGKKLF